MLKTLGKLRAIFEKRYQNDGSVKFEVFETNVRNFVKKKRQKWYFLSRGIVPATFLGNAIYGAAFNARGQHGIFGFISVMRSQ